MKGLVLEIRDGLAAVLREDGQVVTTDLPCQVGETIELPAEVIPFETGAKPKPNRRRWIGGLAAAAVALAVIGGGYSYNTAFASSYLSVDAQGASVELSLNRRGQVIDVRAVDEDSVILAQELSATLDRLPVEEALGRVLAEAQVGCPPCIPIIMSGERIDRETVATDFPLARSISIYSDSSSAFASTMLLSPLVSRYSPNCLISLKYELRVFADAFLSSTRYFSNISMHAEFCIQTPSFL